MRAGIAIITGLVIGAVIGCQSTPKKDRKTLEDTSNLTWEQARERSARVSNVRYQLAVNLNETETTFTGTNRIEFDLKDTAEPLRVDFYEGKVSTLTLNGSPLDPATAKKTYFIEVPADRLKTGRNVLWIEYAQEYSRQGQGLHRFQDPETKQVFLYSQFQTFDANRFMPCFDQPDLRAVLEMEVTAPRDWQVVTTTLETSKKVLAPDRQHWKFAPTPSLATYLFSLHAGPYKVWRDRYQGIPLRLMARPSMAKFVPVDKWFQVTKQGLKFFNAYYALPYPFKKYDQLIVPEFNAGAMENVGAVTFSEWFLSRSQLRRDQWRRTSNVIMHEMAHMWFGDLVTMKWWNDLWLNESFATYMATLALAEATEFKEAWQEFSASDKSWAYWQDGLSTTHPIEAPVPTVKDAFTNFDGITYGKGASVLKQLSAHMGAENFRNGIRDYLSAHAYKNTELKDFIAALQKHTPVNLTEWADLWLRQTRPDKIAAHWVCEGPTLKKIKLTVTPPEGVRFRPQTLWLGLYKSDGVSVKRLQSVKATLNSPEQTVEGYWQCPDLLYPNQDDHGYIRVALDERSLKVAKKEVSRVRDDLTRTMIWADLWRMVRHGEAPLRDYVQIVRRHFAPETNEILMREIVSTISGRRGEEGTILQYWPEYHQTTREEKAAFTAEIEKEYWQRFLKTRPGSDEQRFWFDNFLRASRSRAALDRVAELMDKKEIAAKFPWDPDRQWSVVQRLTRFQHPRADELLARMKEKDPSERGQKAALAAEAVRPDLGVKRKWIDLLKQPKPAVSFQEAGTVLRSLFPMEQAPLAKKFEEDFYQYLKANKTSENEIFVTSFASSVAPLGCESKQTEKLKKFLDQQGPFSPSLKKSLLIGIEEDERCQRIRDMSSL